VSEARVYENPVRREVATLVETSGESGGRRTVVDLEIAPGGGTPPHAHDAYSEKLRVDAGELAVDIGGTRRDLARGKRVTIPAGEPHRWTNQTDAPVRVRVEIEPGHPGYERSLRVAAGLARDGRTFRDGTPKSPLALALLLSWSEQRLPQARLVEMMLRRVAAPLAERFGTAAKLERAYP
jgi:quercetin dioxygenase-like cupin family protein